MHFYLHLLCSCVIFVDCLHTLKAEDLSLPLSADARPNGVAPLPVLAGDMGMGVVTTPMPEISEPEVQMLEYQQNCFYAEAELCLSPSFNGNNQTAVDPNSCQCRPHPSTANAWYCCNITHMSMISTCSNVSSWRHLHIRNLSMPELDISNSIFQPLHSLTVSDSNITQVTRALSRASAIKCLNISNTNLSEIAPRAVSNVAFLQYLILNNNNLSRIPKLNQNKNIIVDVRDNKRLLCGPLLEIVARDNVKFYESDVAICLVNYTYNWFNSTEYASIWQMELTAHLEAECPVIPGHGNCKCNPEIMIALGDQARPKTKLFGGVDCSNLGLTEFPAKLPENTISLNISHNNITSIGKHFHSNPTYQNIIKVVADNNQISSIYELEGTKFMDTFQRLSLRYNALTKIPEYLLTNAFHGDVGRLVYLGGNTLQCDCNSAKVLKIWLLERSRDIPDYNEILCRNMPQRVMELQELKVCQSPHDWTDYIYYLIATEVIFLLALITKVSYDYWVFKTSGYLPWPASKMPKLPCDWLCES